MRKPHLVLVAVAVAVKTVCRTPGMVVVWRSVSEPGFTRGQNIGTDSQEPKQWGRKQRSVDRERRLHRSRWCPVVAMAAVAVVAVVAVPSGISALANQAGPRDNVGEFGCKQPGADRTGVHVFSCRLGWARRPPELRC